MPINQSLIDMICREKNSYFYIRVDIPVVILTEECRTYLKKKDASFKMGSNKKKIVSFFFLYALKLRKRTHVHECTSISRREVTRQTIKTK
jgi:hypothetical protein